MQMRGEKFPIIEGKPSKMKHPKCRFFIRVRCEGLRFRSQRRGRGEEGGRRQDPRLDTRMTSMRGLTSSCGADPPPALSSASKKPAERGSLGDTGRALSLLERGRITGAGQQTL